MKRSHLSLTLTLVLVLSNHLVLHGQEKTIILSSNLSGSTKEYVARDNISLLPGFSFAASSGQHFNASIDPTLIFPPAANYLTANGTITTDPTLGGVVGSIPGQFAVSPTGAATYTIPIECPQGINGMQPNISLVYNSQSGNGIAGWGWHIAGLSAITRSKRTTYYDGIEASLTWDASSPLALDGQRLIEVGRWGNDSVEYRTVNDNFDRIVGYGIQSWGASHFKVYTKSGTTLTYGSTASLASYAPLYENALTDAFSGTNYQRASWNLVEVSDKHGNFMSLEYACYEASFVGNVVKRILYGTNKNKGGTQNIVLTFNYEQRPDEMKGFVAGKETLQELRLASIQSAVNGSLQMTYTLTYAANQPISRLVSVGTSVNGQTLFNPTAFDYGKPAVDMTETDISQINRLDFNTEKDVLNYQLMDMDGDGINEITVFYKQTIGLNYLIQAEYFKQSNGWEPQQDGRFTLTNTLLNGNIPLTRGLSSKFGDYNGDGFIDFTYSIFEPGPDYLYLQIWDKINENKLFDVEIGNVNKEPFMATGKFYGDPRSNLLLVLDAPETITGGFRYKYVIVKANAQGVLYIPTAYGVPTYSYLYTPKKIKAIMTCNFNANNNRDELLIKHEDNTFSHVRNSNNQYDCFSDNTFAAVTTMPFSVEDGNVFEVADMNQDGLVDVVYQVGNNIHQAINKGNLSFIDENLALTCDNDNIDNDVLFLSDFNNDGWHDIILLDEHYQNGSFNHTSVSFYINNSGTYLLFDTNNSTRKSGLFCFGDALGHGMTEYIHFNDSGSLVLTDFGHRLGHHMLSTISDPMNGDAVISYKTLAENNQLKDLYDDDSSINTSMEYFSAGFHPFNTSSLSVVAGVETARSETSYEYGKALNSWTVNGFVGYKNLLVTDEKTGISTLTYNQPVAGKLLLPEKTEVTLGSHIYNNIFYPDDLIANTTFDYSTVELGNKRYFLKLDEQFTNDKLQNLLNTETYTYDVYGNVLTKTTLYNYEAFNNTISYHYATVNCWCPNVVDSIVTTRSRNDEVATRKVSRTYDAFGNLIAEITDPGHFNAVRTDYKNMDDYGNPQRVEVTANGNTRSSSMTYTPSGRFVQSKTDPLGNTETYDWDETKGLLNATETAYGVTSYTYDALGRLTETRTPDGLRSTECLRWADPDSTFGAIYYRYSETSGQPPVKSYYNTYGTEVLKESYGINNQKILIRTTYDDLGQVYQVSDPYFKGGNPEWASTYSYDAYGRVETLVTKSGTSNFTNGQGYVYVASPEGDYATEYNILGQKVYSENNTYVVDYEYDVAGNLKKVYPSGIDGVENVTPISLEYDLQGNRTKITDPDAGIVESLYNGFGELMWSRQSVQNASTLVTTTKNYHANGLLRSVVRMSTDPSGVTDSIVYTYDAANRYRLSNILLAGKHNQAFSYDDFDRVTEMVETIDSRTYSTRIVYDNLGREKQHVYPSGYTVTNHYDGNGYLTEVSDDCQRSLWKVITANARGSLTRVSKGDSVTDYSYDDRGYLTGIKAANIINAHYSHTNKGNLEYRIDNLTNQREDFLYDDLNRLTDWNVTRAGVVTSNSLTYDDAGPVSFGNMVAKSDLGDVTMHYDLDGRPHSLDSISGVLTTFPLDNLLVTYTGFKKIATLSEGANHYTVTYGVDNQRRKSVHQVNGITTLTRYYVGNYEEEIDASGNVRKIHYISGGDGLAAILISDHGQDSLYYAYTDLLGSLTTLTDANGNVLERFAYDPWGKRRNPSDWTQVDVASTHRVNRGYTMHEHLDAFQIINMNGRVYDPLTAQFFSPDPFIQSDGDWLNYNRYAYCMNNPLKYTDPSGEMWWLLPGYFLYGTEAGYNMQKYLFPVAWHIDVDMGNARQKIGIEVSIGLPQVFLISFRGNFGASYYWNDYDNSYTGWEGSKGAEWSIGLIGQDVRYGGTKFYREGEEFDQIRYTLTIGNPWFNIQNENDARIGELGFVPWLPKEKHMTDKHLTEELRLTIMGRQLGLTLFTGEAIGIDDSDGPNGTYIENPKKSYRAGIIYLRIGLLKIGFDSERIRDATQNRFHDIKGVPRFKIKKSKRSRFIWQFGF